MNALLINQAYRFVAIALMLVQVNYFCNKTGLPTTNPITQKDVREGSHIGPPSASEFTGSIVTDKYLFGFIDGHLAHFKDSEFTTTTLSDADIARRNIRLSKLPSEIDTNGAYRLATNWLVQLGVDFQVTETKYHLRLEQWRYYPDGQVNPGQLHDRTTVWLPIYQVEWRGPIVIGTRTLEDRVAVGMTISGVTQKLISFDLQDHSIMSRPRINIKERDKLLSVRDDEFQGLNEIDRSNLVARFGELDQQTPRKPLESTPMLPTKDRK
jgi:hypothetical protein